MRKVYSYIILVVQLLAFTIRDHGIHIIIFMDGKFEDSNSQTEQFLNSTGDLTDLIDPSATCVTLLQPETEERHTRISYKWI